MNKTKRIAVICLDTKDFIEWKKSQGYNPIDTYKSFQVNNEIYYAISKPQHLCSLSIDKIEETHDAYLNSTYHEIIRHAWINLALFKKEETKPTAEEFLKSKGWNENSPIIGGVLFKGIAELLEEYAKLQPFDPNIKRFPSEQEINSMADKYPDGRIYVYAGIEQMRQWFKKQGLL